MPLYLIAILPPDQIKNEVLEFKELMYDSYGCKVALKSPAHITLIPPFSLARDQVSRLNNDLESFSSAFQTFEINLRNFNAFPPRVIYVHVEPNHQLSNLQKELEGYMLGKGYPVKKETRPFHPHVTIANRDLKKQDFATAWKAFQEQVYQASFLVNEIGLLEHNGSKWTEISQASLKKVKEI